MDDKSLKSMLNFIAEAGLLKRTPRSGWSVLGVSDPESVAGHSFRCAIIAYLLAQAEGIEPYKAMLMGLLNDVCEARITDLHKMAQRYLNSQESEDNVFTEQIAGLPDSLKKELNAMRVEYRKQESRASKIARDADILECLIQAKEYHESGNRLAAKFMVKAPECLETQSARRLWELARDSELNSWWESLSDFKR